MLARVFQRRLGALALLCTGLVLGPVGDVEPDRAGSCVLSGGSARVHEGSRLSDTGDGRLTLTRGRTLPCDDLAARDVLAALEAALGNGTGGAIRQTLDERRAILRIHVDPRLPARQAPLGGIEVHVSSRELLVERAALAALPDRAWRHELLHALAPSPPPLSRAGRQLWLTLEEGLVAFLTDVGDGPAADTLPSAPLPAGADAADGRAADRRPQLLPLLEWLESPAYDPHPLAAGLARALENTGAEASSLLDCLTADPARVQHGASNVSSSVGREAAAEAASTPRPLAHAALPVAAVSALPAELADVFAMFGARCSAGAQAPWGAALARWWGTPPARPSSEEPPGKAAARALESR